MISPPGGPPPNDGYPPPSVFGQVTDAPVTSPHGAEQRPGGYGSPGSYGPPGAYTEYVAPARPTTPVLGRVALAAGLVALVGSLVNALIVGALVRPEALDNPDGGTVTVMMSLGLMNLLVVWFGFGLWAIIQGIVAITQNRGTAEGVGALVLGLLGPWVGVAIALTTLATAFADV